MTRLRSADGEAHRQDTDVAHPVVGLEGDRGRDG